MTDLPPSLLRYLAPFIRNRRCGARTRSGKPCKMHPVGLRNDRCRLHGGLSTGPRTPEGRARIAEAQMRRWARWRAERVLETRNARSEENQSTDPALAPEKS
ncbi:HGGxSTG domain-containing protein [Albimonas sp. CAU 1670]|nr:HGGxSTG domain-containing protein [Albimonas sp. CAU 1670]MDF2234959.1 HGGxSTG domain-containing protein [Albimonas sp. CAU 1670]